MITNASQWQRPAFTDGLNIESKVREMLTSIRRCGDKAIEEYSLRFDNKTPRMIDLKPFTAYPLDSDLAEAIQLAATRIEKFAQFQQAGLTSKEYQDEFGTFGQVITPIERVGAYIPGGRFPLISTALMTLIPARVAGCPVRIACSPSDDPAILAAASLAGATQFIQLGGVQAMGALSCGYQSISPVDLIVGPGNAWVNEAKKQLQSVVKIDGLAGPSEMLAICDNSQPIEWLALDALAQAEHDPLACSLIVSDNKNWLTAMLRYLDGQQTTRRLLKEQQVALILAESVDELINFSESFAPEHLMLCHAEINPSQLNNYGSLFVGANSAVALGDYISGPNHTLPTMGYARQTGGLSVNTFLKIQTMQQINDSGRKQLSLAALALAEAEGLKFHAQSLQTRCR